MKIARVFPRRTKATPDDELAFSGPLPRKLRKIGGIDEVHISVTFTYDLEKAERLEKSWRKLGVPVKMGGPAFKERGGIFVPGMYLKHGYVITSRGCPNRCWFCSVPEREGYELRELPITEGFNVLDDNLLACSRGHIESVFDMLNRQERKPVFTGGLEAKLLRPWHAKRLKEIKTQRMYFAYDTPDDYEPLVIAGRLLREAGFTALSHSAESYVLIGYPGDSFDKAERRLTDTAKAGFVPYAMLYRDEKRKVNPDWKRFQREWCRPIIACGKFNEIWKSNV